MGASKKSGDLICTRNSGDLIMRAPTTKKDPQLTETAAWKSKELLTTSFPKFLVEPVQNRPPQKNVSDSSTRTSRPCPAMGSDGH